MFWYFTPASGFKYPVTASEGLTVGMVGLPKGGTWAIIVEGGLLLHVVRDMSMAAHIEIEDKKDERGLRGLVDFVVRKWWVVDSMFRVLSVYKENMSWWMCCRVQWSWGAWTGCF
jgi:hypothetical protein